MLDEFDALLGEWKLTVPQFGATAGRAVFERLKEGGFVVHGSVPFAGAKRQAGAARSPYHGLV